MGYLKHLFHSSDMSYMNCVANQILGLYIIVFIHYLHQNYLYEHGNYYMNGHLYFLVHMTMPGTCSGAYI